MTYPIRSITDKIASKDERLIIRISSEYEIARFNNGEWSFRQKIGDDVLHIRYLNRFEKQLVDSVIDDCEKEIK